MERLLILIEELQCELIKSQKFINANNEKIEDNFKKVAEQNKALTERVLELENKLNAK